MHLFTISAGISSSKHNSVYQTTRVLTHQLLKHLQPKMILVHHWVAQMSSRVTWRQVNTYDFHPYSYKFILKQFRLQGHSKCCQNRHDLQNNANIPLAIIYPHSNYTGVLTKYVTDAVIHNQHRTMTQKVNIKTLISLQITNSIERFVLPKQQVIQNIPLHHICNHHHIS